MLYNKHFSRKLLSQDFINVFVRSIKTHTLILFLLNVNFQNTANDKNWVFIHCTMRKNKVKKKHLNMILNTIVP